MCSHLLKWLFASKRCYSTQPALWTRTGSKCVVSCVFKSALSLSLPGNQGLLSERQRSKDHMEGGFSYNRTSHDQWAGKKFVPGSTSFIAMAWVHSCIFALYWRITVQTVFACLHIKHLIGDGRMLSQLNWWWVDLHIFYQNLIASDSKEKVSPDGNPNRPKTI